MIHLVEKSTESGGKSNPVEVSDEKKQLEIIRKYRVTLTGGHQGFKITFKRIRSYYYFPKMYSKIEKFIKSCEYCQRNKPSGSSKVPMMITTQSKRPFEI